MIERVKGMIERARGREPINPQSLLEQAIEEYKKGPLTPESVINYWRAKLQVDGARAGLDIEVPDCDWTEEEIQRPMVDIEGNSVPSMMAYKPEQLGGKEGLILLGKMYPQMTSFSVREDTPVTDTHGAFGWIKVETTIDAPNCNTRQKELEDFAARQRYLGQRETTYILVSQASKDLTDLYLDQGQGGTWVRLLESRHGGDIVSAGFYSDGVLRVNPHLNPQDRNPLLGARFEEIRPSLRK